MGGAFSPERNLRVFLSQIFIFHPSQRKRIFFSQKKLFFCLFQNEVFSSGRWKSKTVFSPPRRCSKRNRRASFPDKRSFGKKQFFVSPQIRQQALCYPERAASQAFPWRKSKTNSSFLQLFSRTKSGIKNSRMRLIGFLQKFFPREVRVPPAKQRVKRVRLNCSGKKCKSSLLSLSLSGRK